jgi:hypothetical protein
VAAAMRSHSGAEKAAYGRALRARALRDHTYAARAAQADFALRECLSRRRGEVPAQQQPLATMRDWAHVERAIEARP